MGLSVGEVFIARIMGTVLGQQFAVTQFYRSTQNLPSFTGAGVGGDVWNVMRTNWRALQGSSSNFRTTMVQVASITNPLGMGGTYDIPPAEQVGTGLRNTEPMPPFVAFGITLRAVDRLVRPGSRRLPFVLEDDCESGVLRAAVVTTVQIIAEQFAEPLTSGDVVVGEYAIPVLVGRTALGAYDLARVAPVVTANAAPRITSQVSRKVGRGS